MFYQNTILIVLHSDFDKRYYPAIVVESKRGDITHNEKFAHLMCGQVVTYFVKGFVSFEDAVNSIQKELADEVGVDGRVALNCPVRWLGKSHPNMHVYIEFKNDKYHIVN